VEDIAVLKGGEVCPMPYALCPMPELNPIERVGQHIKRELSWEISENLDEIKEKVRAFIEILSRETIASITGWDYILSALNTLCMILKKWY
jgi:hypothetical protein